MYKLTCPKCRYGFKTRFVRVGAATQCDSCQHKYHIKAHNVQHTTKSPQPGPDHPLMSVILEQFRTEAMAESPGVVLDPMADAVADNDATQVGVFQPPSVDDEIEIPAAVDERAVETPVAGDPGWQEPPGYQEPVPVANAAPPIAQPVDATPVPAAEVTAEMVEPDLVAQAAPDPAAAFAGLEDEANELGAARQQRSQRRPGSSERRLRGEALAAHLAQKRRTKSIILYGVIGASILIFASIIIAVITSMGGGEPTDPDVDPDKGKLVDPGKGGKKKGPKPNPKLAIVQPSIAKRESWEAVDLRYVGLTAKPAINVLNEKLAENDEGDMVYSADLMNTSTSSLAGVEATLQLVNIENRVFGQHLFHAGALGSNKTFRVSTKIDRNDLAEVVLMEWRFRAGNEPAFPFNGVKLTVIEQDGRKLLRVSGKSPLKKPTRRLLLSIRGFDGAGKVLGQWQVEHTQTIPSRKGFAFAVALPEDILSLASRWQFDALGFVNDANKSVKAD